MKGRINLILICLVFCVCYYSLEKKYDIQTLKETYALNTLNNEVVENTLGKMGMNVNMAIRKLIILSKEFLFKHLVGFHPLKSPEKLCHHFL